MSSAPEREGTPRAVAPVRQGLMQAGFFLLVMFSLLSPLMILSDLPGLGRGSPVRQVAHVGIFLLLLVAARPIAEPRRLLPVPWPILVALGWCWLSLAWSISRSDSFSLLALTTIFLWGVFLCVAELRLEQILLLVRAALVLMLVLNFAVLALDPVFAIHQGNDMVEDKLAGDWRGIMMHKNFAGALMAMVILFFTFHASNIRMIFRVAVIAAATVFLAGTTSKTSVGMAIVALAVGLLLRHYKSRYRPFAVLALMIAGSAAVVLNFVYHNPFKRQWSNPDAFTGRTQIWDMLIRYWQDHPWLGSGYGAFWNIGGDSPVYEYASNWVTRMGTGHNGYLDLLAQTGVIGVILIVGAVVILPLYGLLFTNRNRGERLALLGSVLVFCIGHNFTETSVFDRDAMVNLFLLLSAALILKGESRSRRARPMFPIPSAATPA